MTNDTSQAGLEAASQAATEAATASERHAHDFATNRRHSDSYRTLPRSNVAKVAIACSFFFSTSLLAWAFTLPFRSGGIDGAAAIEGLSPAEIEQLEYEARLSPAAYVEHAKDIDRRLLDRVREKKRSESSGPSPREVRQRWEDRMQERKDRLDALMREAGPDGVKKGTLEWQNLKELESLLQDAPPEA